MKSTVYIEYKKSVLGGKPVIVGTRFPVSRLLYLLSRGFTFEDIHEEFPQLSTKKISGVIETIAEEAEKGRFFTPTP